MKKNEDEIKELNIPQKVLFLFIIPLLYTIILLAVLIFIFTKGDNDFANKLRNLGSNIPYVNKYIPKIVVKTDNKNISPTIEDVTKQKQDLQKKINDSQTKISQLETKAKEDSNSNQILQKQIQDLNDQIKNKQNSEDELKKKANSMAQEYSSMKPKIASNILSNMTINDAVFILSAMNTAQVTPILENMDPKKAADITIALKDFTISKDNEISSLQDKIKNLTNQKQTLDNLVNTYKQMTPLSASKTISQMMKNDSKKAIEIMSQIDATTRAQILSAMIADKTNVDGTSIATQIITKIN
jgi:flagellar motility protein MotE (MotC chaperone)